MGYGYVDASIGALAMIFSFLIPFSLARLYLCKWDFKELFQGP